ncbi:ubiquinone/menaquinone biosynthesis C-methylase UbiE [Paenibacillus castaneae]|nr:ubiquinone/menaquinone biosynthesis C-methylase UbiE [Paenibacillus castaneae]
MEGRIAKIREEERKYHESCYENYKLFEAGTWLHKPVKTVMDHLMQFQDNENISILDLGSGVGRNSIPMAETLKHRSGRVVCVDILESALNKLMNYSDHYDVKPYIEPVLCEIEDYNITENHFHYIVAVSTLEHVKSEALFVEVLMNMAAGTLPNGINCIIFNTNCRETDIRTGQDLQVFMEVNLSTEKAIHLFNDAYKGWQVIDMIIKKLEFTIERNGVPIRLTSDCLTYVAKKRCQA